MSSSAKAQNRIKACTSSKAQLVIGAFRFTIANVSRLVKTTSTPVTIAGAKFRCIVSRAANHLQIAVTAEGNYGELEAEVSVTVLTDSGLDVTECDDFTFKKDAVLQWPEFAEWDQLFAAGDDDGRNDGGASADVGARANRGDGDDTDDGSERDGGTGGSVAKNDSMDIVFFIVPDELNQRKKKRSANESVKGKKTGATSAADAKGREAVGEGTARNGGDTAVASTSGSLKKVTWAEATPQHALPKLIASQFTQTEMKVAHQLTQTEDDGLFSSKIDVSTIAKAFECQVCYSLFQPPISLCSRGHSFCRSCKIGVQQCPTCEAAFPADARNFALEGIMDYMLYPCLEVPCPVMFLLSEREKHKLECKERQVLCHNKQLLRNVPCTWNGPLDQFYDHCTESHPEKTHHATQDEFIKIRFQMKGFEAYVTASTSTHILDGKIFTIRLSNSNDNFYTCVRMFGTQSEAKQFTCEMRLVSQDPAIDYEFHTSFQVHCDLEKKHGKCISLSTLDVIRENGLIDADGNLAINVRIFRK